MHKHGKMNQAFKLVWSEARGRYIVAPESAKGQGKSSRSVDGVLRNALLAFSGLLFFGYGAGVGATQPATTVVPVAGSGNTSTYIAPNGVPVVNINTANGAGVSNNVYSTFNVESKGLVLNNWAPDRGTTGQSQLAGAVVFNPNLDKEAKVILNQVNSTSPSVLKGFMEVHGGTADLVVANPNGIACDGCGGINTNHLTLTTGTPNLDAAGALSGFDVTQGGIQVTGAGMNGSRAAQVDLVARSIVVDGGVSASENGTLQLIAGANRWRYADGAIEAAQVPAQGDAPAYAVDSTVFGGLSAGSYTAGGAINSTSTGDTTLVGSVFKAGGDINVTSTEGSVSYLAAKDVQSTREKVEKESGAVKLTLVGNMGLDGSLNTMEAEHQQTLTTGIAGKMTSTNGSVNVSAQKDVTLQGVKVDAAKNVNIEAREGSVTLSAAETTRESNASSDSLSIGASVSALSLMDAERGAASVNVGSYTKSSVSRQQTGGSIDAKGDVNIRSKGDQTLVGTTINASNISLASEKGGVHRVDARHDEHSEESGFQIGVATTATPIAIGKGPISSTSAGAIEFGGQGVMAGLATTLNARNDVSIRAAKDAIHQEGLIGAGSLP